MPDPFTDIGVIVAFGLFWNWYCYRLAEGTVQARLQPNQKLLSVQVITTSGYGFCLVSHIGFCVSLMCSTLCTCCCKEAVQRGESELEPICGRDQADRQRLHDEPAQNSSTAHSRGVDETRANRSPHDHSGSIATEDPSIAIQMTDLRTMSSW
jgi:hypothetical protein